MKTTILIIIIALMFVALVGLLIEREQTPQLPSQSEIQQWLVEMGYGIEVDGVIGEKSRAAWDVAYCNQSAAQYNYLYEAVK